MVSQNTIQRSLTNECFCVGRDIRASRRAAIPRARHVKVSPAGRYIAPPPFNATHAHSRISDILYPGSAKPGCEIVAISRALYRKAARDAQFRDYNQLYTSLISYKSDVLKGNVHLRKQIKK
ncbi:uncharacterized protein LOC113003250 [Solenopsis invicta]|uniref:uncharacterized protein LOC113003250 n=1 Tax=Solenopsis invicta TaxID=13686 RepID=UPI000E33F275|nr:uncharacterized protein LOC113003250 [Solenopsis invicta]